MVDNQHKKIIGYRDLSQAEINAMNHAKKLATDVGTFADDLRDSAAWLEHVEVDQRWLAIARTQLQQGFMALNRAIAKPTTF
jgi:hypothetical protein